MNSYEICFHGPQGSRQVRWFALFASDSHALFSAQRFLNPYRPTAAIWQEERRVGEVHRAAPALPKPGFGLSAKSQGLGINIG
jgi:hypothetical protein